MAGSHQVCLPSVAWRSATSLTDLVADLLVDDVAADQQLARARLERVEVDVPTAQAGAFAVERGDAGAVDEDAPTLAGGDEPEHPWCATAMAGNDDDVVEPADGGTARVEQRQAHDAKCVDQLPCHAGKATPHLRRKGADVTAPECCVRRGRWRRGCR